MGTIPADENEFPKVLFTEGAAAATPDTNLVVAYAKSDGLLYSKDDAGTETALSAGAHIADTTDAHDASAISVDPTGLSVITGTEAQTALEELDAAIGAGGIPVTIIDAAGDLIIGTAADTAARLARGTATQALVATGSTVAWADVLPWHVFVIPMMTTQDASTGTWTLVSLSAPTTAVFPFYGVGSTANSGGASALTNSTAMAINDAWAVDVILAAGTWDFHAWVRKGTNAGIITLEQDGASQGTADTYAAATAEAKVSITGWTVTTTGKHRMNLKMASKNASSSNYLLAIMAIEFRRTA